MRRKRSLILLNAFCAVLLASTAICRAAQSLDLRRLERSFRLQVSLANLPPRTEWNDNLPPAIVPSEFDIRHAAQLLTDDYAANRLYLIYQKELPLDEAERTFLLWRKSCPLDVEIVPVLVLHAGKQKTSVFSSNELRVLSSFFEQELFVKQLGLIGTQQSDPNLSAVSSRLRLLNLDLAAGQKVSGPFSAGTEELMPLLADGASADDWAKQGLIKLGESLGTLESETVPRAFTLTALASDAISAEKALPLPAGRNAAAAALVIQTAPARNFRGFSFDLNALQFCSRTVNHDGSGYGFFEMLKRGQVYIGFYARPFHEVVKVYQGLRSGVPPQKPGSTQNKD